MCMLCLFHILLSSLHTHGKACTYWNPHLYQLHDQTSRPLTHTHMHTNTHTQVMPEEGDHEKGEGGGGEEAAGGGSTEDPRLEALSQYTLKTIKQKPDKWAKMMGLEENVMMINEFLEKPEIRLLVIFANQQGLLTPSKLFPNSTKTKAVYFLKRQADAVKKENIKALLIFGDMSHVPLDQLASIVESVSCCMYTPVSISTTLTSSPVL